MFKNFHKYLNSCILIIYLIQDKVMNEIALKDKPQQQLNKQRTK